MTKICEQSDHQETICSAQSLMCNGKDRHMRHRHNTVRQLISRRIIYVDLVRSKDNIADPLNVGLNRDQVDKNRKEWGSSPYN